MNPTQIQAYWHKLQHKEAQEWLETNMLRQQKKQSFTVVAAQSEEVQPAHIESHQVHTVFTGEDRGHSLLEREKIQHLYEDLQHVMRGPRLAL